MNYDSAISEQHKRFLSWLATVVLCGVVAIIFFVGIIDPYSQYGWFKQAGINAVKPDLSRYAEEIKLTQAIKLKPDTLIFGNSRAEIGFDPESPALMQHGYSAYNLAIRGTTITSSHRQLTYLLQKGIKPKRVLIALDFVDFMNPSKKVDAGAKRIAVNNADFPVDKWYWRFDGLFSMASMKDAINTLLIQNNSEAATMTERGFNPLREYQELARNEGYFVLFRQRAEENAKTYLKKASGRFDKTDFIYLRAMLKNAVAVGSEVIIIIYPYHAQILALFEETGLLPAFIQWKKEIIAETQNFSVAHKEIPIRVIDFSGYGQYQCERIPGKGDLDSTTQWYWEAGHFKKALGDIVLQRSLMLTANSTVLPQNDSIFGVTLNKINLESNRQRMNREKERCAQVYPKLFEEVKTLVESLR